MEFSRRLAGFAARKFVVRPLHLPPGRAVASFTFDDFPKNAWKTGGPILARHDVRATYYTAGHFCGRTMDGLTYYDRADLEALQAAGHEIGCHSYAHQPAPDLADEALIEDTRRNAAFLQPFGGATSYAFPYGAVSPRSKHFHMHRFDSLRGVHPGFNQGRIDLAQLSTVSLESRLFAKDVIADAIACIKREGGWLVFHTHDVSETPTPYGSTPQALDWTLGQVSRAGIPVLPMRDALKVLSAP